MNKKNKVLKEIADHINVHFSQYGYAAESKWTSKGPSRTETHLELSVWSFSHSADCSDMSTVQMLHPSPE